MNPSNYPPGVTGNEPEIAGDIEWERVHEKIDADATKYAFDPADVLRVWESGLTRFLIKRERNRL